MPLTAVDIIDITRPEAPIMEALVGQLVADQAKVFQQFTSKVADINYRYVLHIIAMGASRYGDTAVCKLDRECIR
jgi:hypothetical protein